MERNGVEAFSFRVVAPTPQVTVCLSPAGQERYMAGGLGSRFVDPAGTH